MSVSTQVAERINRIKRGHPFSINGFYTIGSRTAVQKAMSRLTKEGVIERVSKGMYARPKPLPSFPTIKVTASASQVAQVWAKEHGYQLASQGLEEAYRLGLQTQAPMKTVFWSNGPSRQFQVGNEVVEIKHVSMKKLKWAGLPEGSLLRGMAVSNPESVNLKIAFTRLSLSFLEIQRVIARLKQSGLSSQWLSKLSQFEAGLT